MSQISDDDEVFYSAQSLQESQLEIVNTANSSSNPNSTVLPNSPKSPYFQVPKEGDAVRFTSPILSPKTPIAKDSILEELLPSYIPQAEADPTMTNPGISVRMFGWAFKICFSIWLVAAVFLYLTSPKGSNLTSLRQVTNWFIVVLTVSIFGALTLAKLLASQAESVVYGMAAAIPIGSAFLGFYLLGAGWLGTVMAVGLFILSAGSGIIFWSQKEELEISMGIIKTGAKFLLEQPKAFTITGQIAFGYAFFVLLWLGSFCRLLAVSFFPLRVLFVAVLLWTSALAGVVNKFLIGKRVKGWLLDEVEEEDSVKLVERHFDSLCVAAAILAATRFARLSAKALHFTALRVGIGAVSSVFNKISEAIERALARFTDYVIYYLALRDDSDFWSACGGVGRALADCPSLSFTVDSISQLLLFFATLSVSIFSTSIVYYLSAHQLTFKTAALFGIVSYLALDLIAAIFTASIDASFLAYLTIPQCREHSTIQSAFSSKLLDI